ncbi:hypothetical protein HMI55_004826 [Coelomomyces lativittatus]|nr:hypothetical protein HMI55_004826 [Coelomomyces lativittatus]
MPAVPVLPPRPPLQRRQQQLHLSTLSLLRPPPQLHLSTLSLLRPPPQLHRRAQCLGLSLPLVRI